MDSNVISILQLVNISIWVLYDSRLASFVVIDNKETIRMKMEVRDCEIYSRPSPTLNQTSASRTGPSGNNATRTSPGPDFDLRSGRLSFAGRRNSFPQQSP